MRNHQTPTIYCDLMLSVAHYLVGTWMLLFLSPFPYSILTFSLLYLVKTFVSQVAVLPQQCQKQAWSPWFTFLELSFVVRSSLLCPVLQTFQAFRIFQTRLRVLKLEKNVVFLWEDAATVSFINIPKALQLKTLFIFYRISGMPTSCQCVWVWHTKPSWWA